MDDPSLANLPLDDPRCVAGMENCLAYRAAENRSQEVPFAGQIKYRHWATYYYVDIIARLMVVHANNLWDDHRRRAEAVVDVRPSIFQKLVAVGRCVLPACYCAAVEHARPAIWRHACVAPCFICLPHCTCVCSATILSTSFKLRISAFGHSEWVVNICIYSVVHCVN